ncbi:MAG TPA: DinB family protein, partial [Ferruginibacter sp.]|nr:DinB family protein [Ferruginibacter sp.]
MNNAKWFDRKFDFQNESQDIPVIYQRLKETPPQLRKHVSSLSSEQLRYKPGGKWSVIEHCGHLFILEQLWQTRIIDIIRGQPILTAADLDNRATTEGRFNTMNIDNVLNDFENARKITLRQLDLLSPNDLVK